MNNNQPRNPSLQPPLFEALQHKDMVGIIKPTIHIDEFASKMGDDDDIIVVSFYVRDQQAARDLIDWFEKGYDWVLDADRSPGEIRPGRYLVYIEMRRRSSAGAWLEEALDDLTALTEHEVADWSMVYRGDSVPFSQETFDRLVPRSPEQYRQQQEKDLNEVRTAAGLQTKNIYEHQRQDIKTLKSAAGI